MPRLHLPEEKLELASGPLFKGLKTLHRSPPAVSMQLFDLLSVTLVRTQFKTGTESRQLSASIISAFKAAVARVPRPSN